MNLEATEQSLLKSGEKISLYKGEYYILDNHCILVFDETGKFMRSSKHMMGRGPGEYGCIVDFDIDTINDIIEILDASSYKIRKYDCNFVFRSELRFPEPMSDFKILTPDLYAFYSMPHYDPILIEKGMEIREEALQIYSSSQNKVLKRLCKLPSYNFLIGQRYPFLSFNNNQTFFAHGLPNNNILYHIDSEKMDIDSVLEYNFGKYTFTSDDIPLPTADITGGLRFMLNNSDKYAFVIDKFVNSRCYFAFVFFKKELLLISSDKKTKKHDIIVWNKLESGGSFFTSPTFVDNDYFYEIIAPEFLKNFPFNELFSPHSKVVVDNMTEDDNPALVKFKLLQ